MPWCVARTDLMHPVVFNAGSESVDFVRVFRDDDFSRGHDLHGRVAPGGCFDVCLCDADLDAVTITLCWFRGDTDEEYIWRFVV